MLITQMPIMDGGKTVPCQLVARYLDPRWKRYGYPFLAGDLRIRIDDAYCEKSSIHHDDVPSFISRLKRYVPTLEADVEMLVTQPLIQRTHRPVTPQNSPSAVAQHRFVGRPNPQQIPATPTVPPNQRPNVNQRFYGQATQRPQPAYAPVPGQTVKKSKGCGCRKG